MYYDANEQNNVQYRFKLKSLKLVIKSYILNLV